jgi:hypothetical protein
VLLLWQLPVPGSKLMGELEEELELVDSGLRVILALPEDATLQDAKMVAMSVLLREEIPE